MRFSAAARGIRDGFVVVACLCVIVLTAQVFAFEHRVAAIVNQFERGTQQPLFEIPTPAPLPTATGCPFGPGQCGG
jgi:hypothetical protein